LKDSGMTCPICNSRETTVVFEYDAPPEGEVRFGFDGGRYKRFIAQCNLCNHYTSSFRIDTTELYCGDYVRANYGDSRGIEQTFARIVSLEPARSDNFGRVQAVARFAEGFWNKARPTGTVLDIGSGLGVFPYAMKKAGWSCTAVDPDPAAVRHMAEDVGVETIQGDFTTARIDRRFDVVSFNKVLEHVEDPIGLLAQAKRNVAPHGFVYVELPDGEMAAKEGKGREEFFIDHLHVFSFASTVLLAKRAGFDPVVTERLREPSSKYTIRAFLVART
jgi:2-polyprenyl-3-methyl-5-hydroxy-6-metoxy-1,4-benzoquinol methylase